jgi:hypothetical protein
MSGLHAFRYSPLIHCPSLCPYDPPVELFGDDYDPARERACGKVCIELCSRTSEHDRPCLAEFERRRFAAAARKPSGDGTRPLLRTEERRPWG